MGSSTTSPVTFIQRVRFPMTITKVEQIRALAIDGSAEGQIINTDTASVSGWEYYDIRNMIYRVKDSGATLELSVKCLSTRTSEELKQDEKLNEKFAILCSLIFFMRGTFGDTGYTGYGGRAWSVKYTYTPLVTKTATVKVDVNTEPLKSLFDQVGYDWLEQSFDSLDSASESQTDESELEELKSHILEMQSEIFDLYCQIAEMKIAQQQKVDAHIHEIHIEGYGSKFIAAIPEDSNMTQNQAGILKHKLENLVLNDKQNVLMIQGCNIQVHKW